MRGRDPWPAFAALSGAIAIAAGAFGAHAAESRAAEWLATGALYQLVHAVAVVGFGERWRGPARLMLVGSTIFAVTLYAMAFGAPRWLGAVTPIGGGMMIGGWVWVAIGAFRRRG